MAFDSVGWAKMCARGVRLSQHRVLNLLGIMQVGETLPWCDGVAAGAQDSTCALLRGLSHASSSAEGGSSSHIIAWINRGICAALIYNDGRPELASDMAACLNVL